MSARYAPLVLAFLILLCAKTNAFNVYHLGGTDGHPWQTALSYEPGDYRVLKPDGTTDHALAKGEYWWYGIAGTWFGINPVQDTFIVGMIQNFGGLGGGKARIASKKLLYEAIERPGS